MSITYNYTIVSVDEKARCMEIVYTAAGHQTQHIGARLPYEGEALDAIIQMYAPVAYWLEQNKKVVVPTVGLTGSFVSLSLAELQEIEDIKFDLSRS
jgi:hypothetical protein